MLVSASSRETYCDPGLAGAELSLAGAGLCQSWLWGSASGVSRAVSGPRGHLQEEVVRMGASEEGSFTDTLGQGLADFFLFSVKGKVAKALQAI